MTLKVGPYRSPALKHGRDIWSPPQHHRQVRQDIRGESGQGRGARDAPGAGGEGGHLRRHVRKAGRDGIEEAAICMK